MRFINTLGALEGAAFTAALDAYAEEEYRTGRAGAASPPQSGQDTVYGELWLMAIARITADGTQWVVYAITSDPDIPGWPHNAGDYIGGPCTAVDLAQPYVAAGYTVVLRHYNVFRTDFDAADVALT
ncbi:hypothetical protein ACFXB3_07465 [Streptomyces sp. NPDC059447]|uniref:hypothetical protein n=1 Tax=Streptomyces sp. NPDC059447 TaxID=3346834 RepID=UPI003675C415